MDFYQAQDDARRSTTRLIVYFILAVVSLIIMVNLLVMLVFGYLEDAGQLTLQNVAHQFDWMTFFVTGAVVVLIIAAGSAYKIMTLSGGGQVVAESLGGAPVHPDTRDPLERRVLNVVEEMAVASGTPVPPVYLLQEEDGINAFAAGNTPADAVIGITRGTAERLSRDELQGVVAHEFSHILNGDMRMNIRLMGVLHGILIIGMIGYFILRSMTYGRRRSNDKNGAPILALAIGLMVIGFAGTFFGNLIKASVSRKRELLADASAVQFTRNPGGIAGALKKIGGYQAGSTLQSPQAPSMSHAFFSQGVSGFLQSLFATHPPLDMRIKRINPDWDGEFETPAAEAAPSAATEAPGGEESGDARKRAVLEGATVAAGVLQANEMIDSVGRPRAEHLQYAGEIIASIPPAVREAAAEPYGARAVIYCLLLDGDPDVKAEQMAHLRQEGDLGVADLVQSLDGDIAALGVAVRLPLIDLAIPALRELSPGQYGLFKRNLDSLIRMDRKINLFEWALQKIVHHNLEPHFTGNRPRAARHGSLVAVKPQIETLLSLLTYACVEDRQTEAFDAARAELAMPDVALIPKERIDLEALSAAVDELALLKPLVKPRLLKACLACITHDQAYSPREMELMRAVADTLDCPMPPYLG